MGLQPRHTLLRFSFKPNRTSTFRSHHTYGENRLETTVRRILISPGFVTRSLTPNSEFPRLIGRRFAILSIRIVKFLSSAKSFRAADHSRSGRNWRSPLSARPSTAAQGYKTGFANQQRTNKGTWWVNKEGHVRAFHDLFVAFVAHERRRCRRCGRWWRRGRPPRA